MPETAYDILQQLEDGLATGDLTDGDYKYLKWKVYKGLRDRDEPIPQFGGGIDAASIVDTRGDEFCYIPTDAFLFGSENELCELFAPVYIARHPVTVTQFTTFLNDTDHPYSPEDWDQLYLVSPDADCPASHVSWDDAKAYCRWLRRITGEYYALPHETEWEKAARGTDGRFYPWGDAELTADWACYETQGMSHSSTIPIGSYPANRSPYGCEEMIGNVWEFCLDSFEDDRDPHILRGGSWCNSWEYCNTLSRTFVFPPDRRVDFGGFRVTYLPGEMLPAYQAAYAEAGPAQLTLDVVKFQQEGRRTIAGGASQNGTLLDTNARMNAPAGINAFAAELNASIEELIGPPEEAAAAVEVAPSQPKPESQTKKRSVEEAIASVTGSTIADEIKAEEEPEPEEDADDPTAGMSVQERMLWDINNASKKYLEEKKARGETVEDKKPLQRYRPEGEKRKPSRSDFVVGAIDELRDDEGGDREPLTQAARAESGASDRDEPVHDLADHELEYAYEPPELSGASYAVFAMWFLVLVAAVVTFVLKLTAG